MRCCFRRCFCLPACLSGCARAPGTGDTELRDCLTAYFGQLELLNAGYPMLDEFREIAGKLKTCVETHDGYFTDYPDAKAACLLMAQIPDVLEQNLEPSENGGYDLRQLPMDWYYCTLDLWRMIYPGVYAAQRDGKNPDDAALLKWLADDSFSDGDSPCHRWLDSYLLGSAFHVQWPETVEWQKD